MNRSLLLASLLVVPFAVAMMPAAAPPCPNELPHEPVILYDFSGSSFGGPIDLALTVYHDGMTRMSWSTQNGSGFSKADLAFVDPHLVRQFVADLTALGADTLCDVPSFVVDLPPTTLTILRGETDARAHTFTWFDEDGNYALINQRIQTFIQTTFPNF